jgi:hypothetical protein
MITGYFSFTAKIISGEPLVATAGPLYAKVPTPGKPPSTDPAIDEPASTKTHASMNLSVRIRLSPASFVGDFGRCR